MLRESYMAALSWHSVLRMEHTVNRKVPVSQCPLVDPSASIVDWHRLPRIRTRNTNALALACVICPTLTRPRRIASCHFIQVRPHSSLRNNQCNFQRPPEWTITGSGRRGLGHMRGCCVVLDGGLGEITV